MHKVDELTAQLLLEYWGGGFEMIYRDTENGLVYLKDYTILFWTLDLEDRDSQIRPEGFIKYERRKDFSVLASHRRGVFAMKAMFDVGVREGASRSKGRTGVPQFRHADERRVHGQGKTDNEHVPLCFRYRGVNPIHRRSSCVTVGLKSVFRRSWNQN